MKNYIYTVFLLVFISSNVFGQAPNWSVNENNFQYTMSIQGFINVDGKTLASKDDKVAAFVNGECRGTTNLLYVPSEKKFIAYLTVFSNVENEVISFKIYDSSTNSIKNIDRTKAFENNKHFGNLFQAYAFASPELSNSAEIVDFSLKDVKIASKSLVDSQVTLFVDKGTSVSSLTALFDLSPGAKLFLGTTNQVSGANSIDFKNPIQFQVLSQDQSVLKSWTIIIKLGTAQFYKKDAVCYAGGVIKVVSDENNVAAVLTKDGSPVTSQNITNGETIFKNLPAGTYSVNVGGLAKKITINQK